MAVALAAPAGEFSIGRLELFPALPSRWPSWAPLEVAKLATSVGKHCSIVAIPSLSEEDARRPNREHEALVCERTRIVSRMKATMVRLGVRGVNIKLRKAERDLEHLRTAEGAPLPPNTLAELRRDLSR